VHKKGVVISKPNPERTATSVKSLNSDNLGKMNMATVISSYTVTHDVGMADSIIHGMSEREDSV
jgi:hypothetical protein